VSGGQVQEAGEDRRPTPAWADEEIDKLRALYPTHSAGAIAVERRSLNSVRAKAQHLGLKKDGPPSVTVKPAKPALRSLSAAVTEALAPPSVAELWAPALGAISGNSRQGVPLLDHHPGQCRWIISDVWPVLYCGAPVVGSSS
jgi:hypothetical protein